MRNVAFFLFLLTAGLTTTTDAAAQKVLTEIRQAPPAVQASFTHLMRTVYWEQFGRLGTTVWYIDQGTFVSKTVFRISSYFVTLTMHFTPQGELLEAYTDQ